MKNNYKPRFAKCSLGQYDNAVEPNQTMSVKQMLYAFTTGQNLPEKIGKYDEDVNIDEIGYHCSDRLEAVDYLNAVNQRIALAKINEAKKAQVVNTETVTETNTGSNE